MWRQFYLVSEILREDLKKNQKLPWLEEILAPISQKFRKPRYTLASFLRVLHRTSSRQSHPSFCYFCPFRQKCILAYFACFCQWRIPFLLFLPVRQKFIFMDIIKIEIVALHTVWVRFHVLCKFDALLN